MEVTKISSHINFYLLKTSNGKFYSYFIEHDTINLYRIQLTESIISDFLSKKQEELISYYKQDYICLDLFINHIKPDDWIIINGHNNQQFMIGQVTSIDFSNVNQPIQMKWSKTCVLSDFDYRFVRALFNRQLLTPLMELKDKLIRLVYPIYQVENRFHLIVKVNQVQNILSKSLYGLQELILCHPSGDTIELKLHIESPGIIEFITEHKEVIEFIIYLIKLFKAFNSKKSNYTQKEFELLWKYKLYKIDTLELDVMNTNKVEENGV